MKDQRPGLEDDKLFSLADFVFLSAIPTKRPTAPAQKSAAIGKGRPSERSMRVADLAARVRRVTQKKPEVMVKVTGTARGKSAIREHLNYITRNGKIVAEREDGSEVDGTAAIKEVAQEWWASRGGLDTAADKSRPKNARETINIILSMPRGTDPGHVASAARSFASAEFGGKHDYLMALHTHETDPSGKTEQPHVHLTVRARGYDGQYLNPRKDDLQRWREQFAAQLRQRGVEAEATPRRTRGVARKGQRQEIRHMTARRASHVTRWKIEQALKAVRGASDGRSEAAPWERAGQERDRKLRRAWGDLAKAFEGEGDVATAMRIRDYLEQREPFETERQKMIKQAEQLLEARKTREKGGGNERRR